MAGTNQYLPIASAAGALVLSFQQWLTYTARQQGFQIGELDPDVFNTMMRQHSVPGAALGQIICDYANVDAVDDGSPINFETNLRIAIAAMLAPAYEAQDTSQSPNAIIAALSPAPPSLNGFYRITIKIANTNTGPVQLNLNGSGLRSVVRRDGTALQAGDLRQGQFAEFLSDGGQWFLAGAARSEIAALVPVGSSGSLLNLQVLTASGTYTKTANTTKALVFTTGGGAAGGAAGSTSGISYGGGAGATVLTLVNLASVSTVAVTIGAGGVPTPLPASYASRAGGGGTTTFGSYATAGGGQGAYNDANNGTAPSGGTGSIGGGAVGIVMPGNPGCGITSPGVAGAGGPSFWGGAAPGVDGSTPGGSSTPAPGVAATGPGSGGSGADNVTGSGGTNQLGGAGAAGVIVVLEFA